MRLTKNCVAIFALAEERLPTSATLEEAESFISLSVCIFWYTFQFSIKPGIVIIVACGFFRTNAAQIHFDILDDD